MNAMQVSRRYATWGLLAPGLGFLVLLFAGPLTLSLLASLGLDAEGSGFTLEHYREIFTRPALRSALLVSLYYGIAPVAVTLLVSIALALLLRRHFIGRSWFNGLYKIPMAVPGLIAALLIMTLVDRGGFLDRLALPLGITLPRLIRDPWGMGVILTTAWKQVPFMTLIITGAFAALPEDIVAAARTLGANRWRSLLLVELPLAAPGITAAVLLTFISSMGSFAVPDLVGRPAPRALAVHMVSEFGYGNVALVHAMGVILSAFAVAVLLAYYALSARASNLHVGAGDSHG